MKTHHATVLPPRAARHGEGACWWEHRQMLIWVDILACEVHLYDPVTQEDRVWHTPSHVGYAQPMIGGELVLGLRDGIYRLSIDDNAITPLVQTESDERNRHNDGKPGPDSRLYGGTMNYDGKTPSGALWRFETDGETFSHALDGVTISNGLCWSADESVMYYVDSPTRQVDAFDFDKETGALSNRRTVVEIDPANGVPDGMTIDAEDNLWVAHWGGSMAGCYSPKSGELLEKVILPVPNVTCPSFGGEDFSMLYITTSGIGRDKLPTDQAELAGHLFAVEPGVQGRAGYVFG